VEIENAVKKTMQLRRSAGKCKPTYLLLTAISPCIKFKVACQKYSLHRVLFMCWCSIQNQARWNMEKLSTASVMRS